MVDHPILLRGLSLLGTDASPTILQRTDQEFIPGILNELARPDGLEVITKSVIKAPGNLKVLKLFQPVHRTFHVAVFEVVCKTFGQPRLDAQQIKEAGLVIRRIAVDEKGNPLVPEVLEGWMQSGMSMRGWVQLKSSGELDMDPDPEFRRPELSAGNPEINRRLAGLQTVSGPLSESISPLFVAPPEVSKATKKTILYGLVPLTSSEFSEVPASLPAYDTDLSPLLPKYLTPGGPHSIPGAGQTLNESHAEEKDLGSFVEMLYQLAVQFGAFGDSKESKALFAALNTINLEALDGSTLQAGDFLRQAAEVLVYREGIDKKKKPTVTMPGTWPKISARQSKSLRKLIVASIKSRVATLTAGQGRFDDQGRQYRIRGFVRVRRSDGCPPKTFWSDHSEPFTIAPWFESSDVPPVQVALPDAMDRGFLKKLKPNVVFSVPGKLFNFLQSNDPEKLLKGEGNKGTGKISLDWICGFNIPIITLCAFIVLNIFLKLLNFIFWWLPFIKICIPFPRKES